MNNTRSQAYRELKSYGYLLSKANMIKQSLAKLQYDLERVKTVDFGVVGGGGGANDRLEGLLDEIEKMKREMLDEIIASEEKRKHLQAKIDSLDFPFNEILFRRYIRFQSYEKIAVEMGSQYRRNYTYDGVKTNHYRGVILFSAI